jgi:hypothetical protein
LKRSSSAKKSGFVQWLVLLNSHVDLPLQISALEKKQVSRSFHLQSRETANF